MTQEYLSVEKLSMGDKPSIYIAGMLVANALKVSKYAVLTQNALGQVVLLSPSVVSPSTPTPLVGDEVLDTLKEEDALALMVREGRNEDDILAYVTRRRACL